MSEQGQTDAPDAPLVSVVVPTYDRPDVLPRAIESVAVQTYPNVELLVVDDHSPTPARESLDGSSVDGFTRFECIRHERNRGGSAARNTGIEAAEGEFIAFLDDDDEWVEKKLERQVAAFEQGGDDIGLVYTGVRQVNGDGETNAVKTPDVSGNVLEEMLCRNFIGTFSAVMVRADVVDRVGTPDERFPSWQDWEWYVRIASESQFGAVPEPLVVRWNTFTDQISADFETKRDESYDLMLETYESLSRERFSDGFERKRRAFVTFELAQAAIQCREYGAARQLLGRAIVQYPYVPAFYVFLGLVSFGRYSLEPIQRAKRMAVQARGG